MSPLVDGFLRDYDHLSSTIHAPSFFGRLEKSPQEPVLHRSFNSASVWAWHKG